MSGMFCNHLLSWVGQSFGKHSSSSLVCLLSATLYYNRANITHHLPHLRWNGRGREEVPVEGRKRWDGGRWEKGGEADRKRDRRDVVVRDWERLCLTSLHSITINHALKLAWRTVQVSLGVSTHHNIPLATSTHTHQSITPHTAHNDWLFWSRLKAVTPGLRWSPGANPFTNKICGTLMRCLSGLYFCRASVHQMTCNATERHYMNCLEVTP